MTEKKKYDGSIPRKMYTYFTNFSDIGAPSFGKFARSIGVTLSELQGYRRHKKFERAWQECNEIRRDYLIDSALAKRNDSSFSKFLLSYEFGMDEPPSSDEESNLKVTLEVV